MPKKEIEAKMDAIIDFAELEDFIDEPINTYSSGMRARLGFATAFQIDPDVLLIDEVLGVGDAEFIQKSTKAMVQRIRSNKTVVLVSHNASLVREVCNRAVWIDQGLSHAVGPVEEVMGLYEESTGERTTKPKRETPREEEGNVPVLG
jgi:lipopolysaccharide transport system ATP-binding protein